MSLRTCSYAHDTLTSFMASDSHEWVVKQRQFGLETAWSATFTHGTGGRTLGVNSEMDALPAVSERHDILKLHN